MIRKNSICAIEKKTHKAPVKLNASSDIETI